MIPIKDISQASPNKRNQQIFTRAWVPEDAVTHVIVLIHGLGEHAARYDHWARKFCATGTAVYAIDLPGHGRSDGKRGHIQSFDMIYDDIEDLIQKIQITHIATPVTLYGHSMGGALVLGAALCRSLNITSIILTGPAIAPGFDPPPWKLKLAQLLNTWVPSLVLGNELDLNGLSRSQKVIEDYRRDQLVHSKISVRWFNEWQQSLALIKTKAKTLSVPVLMIHGEADRLTSPSASAKLASNMGSMTTFKLWPGAYHELHNEPDSQNVFAYIHAWLIQNVRAPSP
jgi:alpha-beta hydrolase superfamily lysophospholipase